MKRMKKVWALVLALVMVLALGVTAAVAADHGEEPVAEGPTAMDFEITYVGHGGPGSVSENGDPLAGSVFVLKQGEQVVKRATSDANGVVKFEGLTGTATYTLEQETAPLGYEKATCNASNSTHEATSVQIKIGNGQIQGVSGYNGIYAEFDYGDGKMFQWPGGDKNTYPNNYTTLEFKSEYDMVTITIPFTKVVKQGGNAAPGSQKFELEIFGNTGNGAANAVVEYTAAVDTNGARTYNNGEMVIKGARSQMRTFTGGTFYVREKRINDTNWTFGDEVYVVDVTVQETGNEHSFTIYPTTPEGNSYHYDRNVTVQRMNFENIYTRNVSYYYNNTTTTAETKGSPKTFDAGIGVYAVSALLSVTGGAWLVGKKHK